MSKIKKILSVDWIRFLKYNYCTRGVHRNKGAYIIPFRGASLEMRKDAHLYVKGTFHFGINKVYGSKTETRVRIQENACWMTQGETWLFNGVLIDVQKNALLETGNTVSANEGTVIVCAKHISLGNDAMLGRNITIYDSDFHQIINNGKVVNYAQEVIIEDHVWLTNNIVVLKGVTIGEGALISAMTLVRKNVEPKCLYGGIPGKVIKDGIEWSRKLINEKENEDSESK